MPRKHVSHDREQVAEIIRLARLCADLGERVLESLPEDFEADLPAVSVSPLESWTRKLTSVALGGDKKNEENPTANRRKASS